MPGGAFTPGVRAAILQAHPGCALLDDHPPPCWCITYTDPPGPDAHAAARAFARQETP